MVAIQGPRQCGKSVLATRLLEGQVENPQVVRLDDARVRQFARDNPDLFLIEHAKARPLVLDEAQKAPGIFDAIKLRVDLNPEPGQYLLLGSTEFSTLFKVRESLTGRMSRLRLHPLSVAEAHRLKLAPGDLVTGLFFSKPRVSIEKIVQAFDHGGMPGIFAVRDPEERMGLLEDWVQLTCSRDIHQIPGLRLDSELARAVLDQVAQGEEPELAPVARAVGESPKVVSKYLKAFEELFVLERLRPHPAGTGKDRYYLCDVGIASFLGADRQRRLETWFLQEMLIKRDLQLAPSKMKFSYFRNARGSRIPLVLEDQNKSITSAFRPIYGERADLRDAKLLESFCSKVGGSCHGYILLADPAIRRLGTVEVHSWASVV